MTILPSAPSEQLADLPSGQIDDTVVVTVVNDSPVLLTRKYARREYTLRPGVPAMVPWTAMALWFGDPRAVNIGTKRSDQHRTKEINRLSVKYGLHGSSLYVDNPTATSDPTLDPEPSPYRTVNDPVCPNHSRHRHPNLPSVKVYDALTQARILTVIDDPEGVSFDPEAVSRTERRDLEEQMKLMHSQLQQMATTLAEVNPEAAVRLQEQLNPSGPGQLPSSIASSAVDLANLAPATSHSDPDLPTSTSPSTSPSFDPDFASIETDGDDDPFATPDPGFDPEADMDRTPQTIDSLPDDGEAPRRPRNPRSRSKKAGE